MPPVARMTAVCRLFINDSVAARETDSRHCSAPSGRPAVRAAASITRKDSITHSRAEGWGLRTTAQRAFTPMSALKIAVEVGLVEGTIAATTPIGSPISVMPEEGSSRMIPTVFMGAMWVATRSAAKRLLVVLSGTLQKPVSRFAIWASRPASGIAARDIAATMRSASS